MKRRKKKERKKIWLIDWLIIGKERICYLRKNIPSGYWWTDAKFKDNEWIASVIHGLVVQEDNSVEVT